MSKPFALASVLLAATPVFAQESADARMAAFVAVFQANNCTLATRGENAISEEKLMSLFANAGIDEEQIPDLAQSLLDNGQASVELETDAFTVLPPLCVVEGGE